MQTDAMENAFDAHVRETAERLLLCTDLLVLEQANWPATARSRRTLETALRARRAASRIGGRHSAAPPPA